jgi:DNA-binding response OmpR family regulator
MAAAQVNAKTVTVLSVSGFTEDHVALAKVLAAPHAQKCSDYRWEVATTESVDSAMSLLENGSIPVVLCEGEPGQESWKALLERLPQLAQPPFLIVGSRAADDSLWAEALNLGAYDVLAKPLEPIEVMRALNLAWLRWKQAHQQDRGIAHRTMPATAVA